MDRNKGWCGLVYRIQINLVRSFKPNKFDENDLIIFMLTEYNNNNNTYLFCNNKIHKFLTH